MPTCIQCSSVVKENASYCPTCGCRNPLDKKNKTNDFTMTINTLSGTDIKYIPKEKKIAAMLAIMVGFMGLHYRYLEDKKMSIVSNIVSAIVFAGTVIITYFTLTKDISISIALGLLAMYIVNSLDGLSILLFARRDGNGELIR